MADGHREESGAERHGPGSADPPPPRIVVVGDGWVAVEGPAGGVARVAVGGTVGGWRLVAAAAGRPAVFEHRTEAGGLLAYVATGGVEHTLRLSVGDVARMPAPRPALPPGQCDRVLASDADVLGDEVLARGEASYEAAAEGLAPLLDYTPICAAGRTPKPVIDPFGRIGFRTPDWGVPVLDPVLFDPAQHVGHVSAATAAGERAVRGLVNGWLPAADFGFWDPEARAGWEEVAFTSAPPASRPYVLVMEGGRWRGFRLDPLEPLGRPDEALEELRRLDAYWRSELSDAMAVELPEGRLRDSSLAGLVRAMTLCDGDHTRYGLGHYALDVHASFPPTILWLVQACLDWGLLAHAERYLTAYFARYVRPDGTFDYYGPAVAEYGQMLALVARFTDTARDSDWLRKWLARVDAMAELLVALRRASLEQPAGAVTRGLLFGSPEADTRDETAYYFSGTAWAWRGLREVARAFREHLGGEMDGRARSLEQTSGAILSDLRRGTRACLVPGDPPFLPPHPGVTQPFAHLTESELSSYTNYRYWPELLSAGALEPDIAHAVTEFRRRRGGEIVGTTRFLDRLDDWPIAHMGDYWLASDQVDRSLLCLYGHLAVHENPGTFASYEQVHVRSEDRRSAAADTCIPVQLTTAMLARRMLVWEDHDAGTLWLCRAVPRRWLEPGGTVTVTAARTRWGEVGFRLLAQERAVHAELNVPAAFAGKVLLRLRRPGGAAPSRVEVDGHEVSFDRSAEAVELPGGARSLIARYE